MRVSAWMWMWAFMERSHADSAVWKIHKTSSQHRLKDISNHSQLTISVSAPLLMTILLRRLRLVLHYRDAHQHELCFRDCLRLMSLLLHFILWVRTWDTILQMRCTSAENSWIKSPEKNWSWQLDDLHLRSENVSFLYVCLYVNYLIFVVLKHHKQLFRVLVFLHFLLWQQISEISQHVKV